jgi:hypothetical protein
MVALEGSVGHSRPDTENRPTKLFGPPAVANLKRTKDRS